MQQTRALIYRLLLLLLPILITSCNSKEYSCPEEESDEELWETMEDLGRKIETHKSLEKSVKDKEDTISSNHKRIKEHKEYIEGREQQVTADIKMAIEASGEKMPTRCPTCQWFSSMAEESFDKLANKYHRGGWLSAKGGNGYTFLNSCPLCTKKRDNEYYENKIKERKEEIDRLKIELDENGKPQLKESRKYIEERKTSYRLMRKLSANKTTLKRERNQALERIEKQTREMEEVRKKLTEKEKENALLKEDNVKLAKEIEEARRRAMEKEKEAVEVKRMIEEIKKQQVEKEKQDKLNLTKELLRNKVDINIIISVTGLLKENIENLL